IIDGVRDTGVRAHILHLSDADSLELIAAAKAEGLPLTVETCPHYLTFLSEEIGDGQTAFKCAPPIREAENRDRLWQGLQDGTIDIIVSDHSPSTLELKEHGDGNFDTAWGGISSLQLGLSVIWTEALQRGVDLAQVISWMASTPADIARVPSKGRMAVGYDADLVVFDPHATWTVDAGALHHRNPITPYDGRGLTGKVISWMASSPADIARVPSKGRMAVGYDADLVVFDPHATWTVDAGALHHRNPITPYDGRELTGKVISTWLRGTQVEMTEGTGRFLRP